MELDPLTAGQTVDPLLQNGGTSVSAELNPSTPERFVSKLQTTLT